MGAIGASISGAVGGWLAKNVGLEGLFAACAGLMFLWLVVAWPMRAPAIKSVGQVLADDAQAAPLYEAFRSGTVFTDPPPAQES